MGKILHYDWSRKEFQHRLPLLEWQQAWNRLTFRPGTTLEQLVSSKTGIGTAIFAVQDSPYNSSFRFWVGPHPRPIRESQGWFGRSRIPFRRSSLEFLRDRQIGHFLILDSSTEPVVLFSLSSLSRLGVHPHLLESILNAKILILQEGLFAESAFVPSLRVYVEYDGTRRGRSTRKIFDRFEGPPSNVETLAEDILQVLGYETLPPSIFTRLFQLFTHHSAASFSPSRWPRDRLSKGQNPLESVVQAHKRMEELLRKGCVAALHSLPKKVPPEFQKILESIGERTLLNVFQGLLMGYPSMAADWFAWEPKTGRSHLFEVKSRGDTLRPSQKESILWCQRSNEVNYQLLEVLHPRSRGGAQSFSTRNESRLPNA